MNERPEMIDAENVVYFKVIPRYCHYFIIEGEAA